MKVCFLAYFKVQVLSSCSNTQSFEPLLTMWMPPAVNRCGQMLAASALNTLNDNELQQGSTAFFPETLIRHFKNSSLGCPSRPVMAIKHGVNVIKIQKEVTRDWKVAFSIKGSHRKQVCCCISLAITSDLKDCFVKHDHSSLGLFMNKCLNNHRN